MNNLEMFEFEWIILTCLTYIMMYGRMNRLTDLLQFQKSFAFKININIKVDYFLFFQVETFFGRYTRREFGKASMSSAFERFRGNFKNSNFVTSLIFKYFL